jgi:ribosomal protein S18 acetylase RimI-like enzyme
VTTLVPMSEDEFATYLEEAVPAYAADKVASGQWTEEEARELSRRSFAELLPQGLATPGHRLFTLRDSATDAAVGMLWIALRKRAGRAIAYVYDIGIDAAHRRRGHATRAFRAIEEMAPLLGASGIALHVFGHNAPAYALYTRLGFHPTNINMFKAVDGAAG